MPQSIHADMRALIYMTARNCEHYVPQALSSLARQTYNNVRVLFVDDASTDHTGEIAREYLEKLFTGRYTIVRNDHPWGKARNAHVHLRALLGETDFVAVLDGDDQLIVPDILARMAASYAAGKDVVWTNYVTDGGAIGNNGPLNPQLSPRRQGWRTSHFFSFRAELLGNVDESYFRRPDGQWFPAACDFAIAFPILDQTRRYQFIAEQAYLYTATNPLSHHNADPHSKGLNSTIQVACAREVLAKAPLPCTRPEVTSVAGKTDYHASRTALGPNTGSTANDAWRQAAAHRLAAECPALLDLAGHVVGKMGDPLKAWALHSLLSTLRANPRVLEIGHGPWAPTLAALTLARQGRFFSIGADGSRAHDLEMALVRARCTHGVTVANAPSIAGTLLNTWGEFPDVQTLGDEGDFDFVMVSTEAAVRDVPSALQALPAVASRVSMAGFHFLLLAESVELQRKAMEAWTELSPGLEYVEHGASGMGLLVSGR